MDKKNVLLLIMVGLVLSVSPRYPTWAMAHRLVRLAWNFSAEQQRSSSHVSQPAQRSDSRHDDPVLTLELHEDHPGVSSRETTGKLTATESPLFVQFTRRRRDWVGLSRPADTVVQRQGTQ